MSPRLNAQREPGLGLLVCISEPFEPCGLGKMLKREHVFGRRIYFSGLPPGRGPNSNPEIVLESLALGATIAWAWVACLYFGTFQLSNHVDLATY